MAAKYLVFAGCNNEGQILQGQPYDGPLDSESVASFALETLRNSPYDRSNTAWGLAELDWQGVEDASDGDGPIYMVQDFDADCDADCEPDACDCQNPPEYWVAVSLAK